MAAGCVENRTAARFAAVRSEVHLGWWGGSGFQTRAASLKNLSRCGALVLATFPPPETSGLWLSVGGTPPSEWAGVSVVAEENPCEGLYRVRLRFDDGCPDDVFQNAVLGISHDYAVRVREGRLLG